MSITLAIELWGHTFAVAFGPTPDAETEEEVSVRLDGHFAFADEDVPWFGFTPSSPDQEPMWEEEEE